LARYYGIKISDAGVYRILKRHAINRLPRRTRLRKIHTTRYEQKVRGQQIQVDVKFLTFQGKDGNTIKRYQDTAIDDATRVRALRIFQGIRHAYIKLNSPQLNGKVERSHRTDDEEFYQLLTYTDDVDPQARLAEWESFYNLSRPHGAFNGKASYETLRERL
jgi:Integrase core domain